MKWLVAGRELDCSSRTLVMGILNVTPDSFSDGGSWFDPEVAVRHGVEMAADGADILDVGGESTRPGSDPVSAEDERDRVVPVIKRLAAELPGVPISIDTRKADVAAAALDAGAVIVNDVSAGRDPGMFEAAKGAGLVLMHMLGEPKTMQQAPNYDDVVTEVREYLSERVDAAVAAGIPRESLCVDPGLGFGKTEAHSLRLMKEIDTLLALDRPVLVGPSRKSFIGHVLGGLDVTERVEGTAGAVAYIVSRGAHIVRVHDVREMTRVVRVVDAINRA